MTTIQTSKDIQVKFLVSELLKLDQEADVKISIDVSTNDDDFDRRAFSTEWFNIENNGGDYSMLLGGYLNK